jgi:hypothetical protein
MATLEALSAWVARTLRPLGFAAHSDEGLISFVEELGWTLPGVPPSLRAAEDVVLRIISSLETLRGTRSALDFGETPAVDLDRIAGELLLDLALASEEIHALPGRIGAELPANFVAASHIDQDFETRLFDFLISTDLAAHASGLHALLRVLGVIEIIDEPEDLARHQPAFVHHTIRWGRLAATFKDPASVMGEVYGWGGPDLAAERLFTELVPLSFALGMPGELRYPPDGFVENIATGASGKDPELQLRVPVYQDEAVKLVLALFAPPQLDPAAPRALALTWAAQGLTSEETPLDSGFALRLDAGAQLGGGAGVVIRPNAPPRIVLDVGGAGGALASGRLGAWLIFRPPEWRGKASASTSEGARIEFASASLGIVAEAMSGADADVHAELRVDDARIFIVPPDGDGFLGRLVSSDGIAATFSLGVRWSREGLHFRGAGGMEMTLPLNVSIGPLTILQLHLDLKASEAAITGEASVTASAKLGPVTVAVQRIGLSGAVDFAPGNLGPISVRLGLKRPEGIGVFVDAGPISGGGSLGYEEATGRYVGALELEVYEVAVKAFGILDTRAPGGGPGYSFLIIVSAEFNPVPLGLGFTLNGVGGVAGIHRRLALENLQARFRAGGLDSIMFPADPVANAAAIASDLQQIFPPASDRYVFGPMAIIGWGSPTLLEGELGILLEFPEPARMVLLGQFHIALPSMDHAIVDLNLDVLGVIEPAQKRLALDGRLRESRILAFPLEGELALRLVGGDAPSFAFSVGGFNPAFQPPPGFPALRRVSVLVGLEDNPRITLQGYLAVTSNTLQIGGLATLEATKAGFTLAGEIGFNAMFVRSPFSFVTDFSGKVALLRGKTTLAAISLDAVLSGPSPWRAAGEACLEIRFLPDICVSFDASFGGKDETKLPSIDPWPLLKQAIESIESWSATTPAGVFRGATFNGASARALIDPAAGASLRQSVTPLNRMITRFGAAQPEGGSTRFPITQITLAGRTVPDWRVVTEAFAAAQFEDLSDDEKLSRPSFEQMDAGVGFAGDAVARGGVVGAKIEYETKVIDSAYVTRGGRPYRPLPGVVLGAAQRTAARAALNSGGSNRFTPPPARPPLARLLEEQFVVASTFDLRVRSDITPAGGKGAVFQALAAHLALHPEDRDRLDVMSLDELSTPA